MAKYRLKSSNNKVTCEVLNESMNNYIVRFRNGVVQSVPKNRVSNLDYIDEAVLDDIRDTVTKYGRKFISKTKDITKKVIDFFVKSFVVDNFVFFKDEQGRVLSAIHPVNAMEGARYVDSVNYVPGSDTIELCNELGITPNAIENYQFEGEYDGAIQFPENTNESVKSYNSLVKTLFEAEDDKRLSKSEKIDLNGTFCDWTQEQIVNYIANEYISRYEGNKPKTLPLMIWGAPGIGKTAIIRSIRNIVKQEIGKTINIISVNGGNVGPDDFTMPAKIAKTIKSSSAENMDDDAFRAGSTLSIQDLPKNWLPVYNPDSEDVDPKVLNAIANGLKLKDIENADPDNIENGPGGIFFIDEYSRMTPAGMDALMQTPTTREIGSNSTLTFGDRWVIVCAANRKSDMSRKLKSEVLTFEGASKTRFNHCNFVPSPESWLEWAKKESKNRPGRKNVIPEITNYITEEIREHPNDFGDFYEMWSHPQGDLDATKGTACPRTWEALSETIIDQALNNRFGKRYDSVADIPQRDLVEMATGIVGGAVANRFANFVSRNSAFTPEDAKNVWTKGDDAKYEIIKKRKLNSANILKTFNEHIFPLLKEYYPGGIDGGVSSDAALNFMKFLEDCCYDGNNFNLNRFNEISTAFGIMFGVDMKSINGPYADVANYKEKINRENELVD